MKGTTLIFFIKSIQRHRPFFWICTILLTFVCFFSFCYKQVKPYDYTASAKLYPLVMAKSQKQPVEACVNPCFMLKRVLSSNDFQKELQINNTSFSKSFTFHETNDHCIEIICCHKDADKSIKTLQKAINISEAVLWGYTSSRLSLEQDYCESIVKDYGKFSASHTDTCNIKNTDVKSSSDSTLQGQVLCLNIIEAPHIVQEPGFRPLIAALLFSFLFAVCFSALITWIYSNSKA